MDELTDRALNILRHTTGHSRHYRNYFVSTKECDNYDILMRLVEDGFMIRRENALDEISRSFVFYATEKGKNILEKYDKPIEAAELRSNL